MRGNGRISQWLGRAMAGRYGVDQFSRFLSIAACVLLIASIPLCFVWEGHLSDVVNVLGIAALIWCYVRTFSRNYTARQKENLRYLAVQNRITGWFRLQRDKHRYRNEYKFYTCPGCKSVVRVPKGKGRLRITCRRCGYSFEKKT